MNHAPQPPSSRDDTISLTELVNALSSRWRLLALCTVVAGAVGAGASFAMRPIFTARTVILPPQQQQSAAASALSSLGTLAGLAGGTIKSPAEQYISLMYSATVTDRVIDQFKLMAVYGEKYRSDTHKALEKNVAISAGKKDGLITVEVDDTDPKRAADIANAFVDGLRDMTNTLAVSEAQQRRAFFEGKLRETQQQLTAAQIALQASGYNPDAIKAEPISAAQNYARLRAEVTTGEARLISLRRVRADSAPEVQQQEAVLSTLREELARLERTEKPSQASEGTDYITKVREFKYQEALFELFTRQYEAARVDESREGGLVQVVDAATPPDKKSRPRRALVALGGSLAGLLLASLGVVARATRSTH